jgi:hypothetical protein
MGQFSRFALAGLDSWVSVTRYFMRDLRLLIPGSGHQRRYAIPWTPQLTIDAALSTFRNVLRHTHHYGRTLSIEFVEIPQDLMEST